MISGIYQTVGPNGFGTYRVESEPELTFTTTTESTEQLLVPGFVDIHIHGTFGIDFMIASREEMYTWCDKLRAIGYEAFLPTTVTSSFEATKRALSVIPDHPMIPGFHLEGPFVSLKYPGAQPQQYIIDPPASPSPWDEIFEDPRLKVITMAAELPGAIERIQQLAARGVVISMGHTNATFAEAKAGFEAGAHHTTHTYNAMRGLHHREAGTVGFAMQEDGLRCEIIYDRIHVVRDAASLLVKCKPLDGIVAVSDSTMAAGLTPGEHLKMWDLDVVVGDHQVRLLDGTLAGSGITLLDAFQNLAQDFGPELAIHATSLTPRQAIGLDSPPKVWNVFSPDFELIEVIALAGS